MFNALVTIAFLMTSIKVFSLEPLDVKNELAKNAIELINSTLPIMMDAIEACDSKKSSDLVNELNLFNISMNSNKDLSRKDRIGLGSCRSALLSVIKLGRYTSEYVPVKPESLIGLFVAKHYLCEKIFNESIEPRNTIPRAQWPERIDRPKQCIIPNDYEYILNSWELSEAIGKGANEVTGGHLNFGDRGGCDFKMEMKNNEIVSYPCEYWIKDNILKLSNLNEPRKLSKRFEIDYSKNKLKLKVSRSNIELIYSVKKH